MHISRLNAHNIKCYATFDVKSSKGVNILIGENSSGKSTILDAILTLQLQRIRPQNLRYGQIHGHISVYLSDIQPAAFVGGLAIFRDVKPETLKDSFAEVRLELSGPSGSIQKLKFSSRPDVDSTFQLFPSQQPNNFLIPYLSSRRASDLPDRVGTQFSHDMSGTLANLQSKIDRCYTSPLLRPKYESACRDVLGMLITSFPVESGKAAGLEIDPLDPAGTLRISDMGAGVAQALGLIVELLTARGQVFVIEELETDLHPTALRSLMKLIEGSLVNGCQFFISTHSNIVLRHLGSLPDSKVFRVTPSMQDGIPLTKLHEVPNDPEAKRSLLAELGYEMADYELYDAWLLLEEASAEGIIREFLIPIFTPRLVGRLRTVASVGVSELEGRVEAFNHLFTFLHLESGFFHKAWVVADGDDAGRSAIKKLRTRFSTWPDGHFQTLTQPAFERYYPSPFQERVAIIIGQPREQRRKAKKRLLEDLLIYLREDPERARSELETSASEVIAVLKAIEVVVLGQGRAGEAATYVRPRWDSATS